MNFGRALIAGLIAGLIFNGFGFLMWAKPGPLSEMIKRDPLLKPLELPENDERGEPIADGWYPQGAWANPNFKDEDLWADQPSETVKAALDKPAGMLVYFHGGLAESKSRILYGTVFSAVAGMLLALAYARTTCGRCMFRGMAFFSVLGTAFALVQNGNSWAYMMGWTHYEIISAAYTIVGFALMGAVVGAIYRPKDGAASCAAG